MFKMVIQAGGIGTFDSSTIAGFVFSVAAFPGPAIVFPPAGRLSPCAKH